MMKWRIVIAVGLVVIGLLLWRSMHTASVPFSSIAPATPPPFVERPPGQPQASPASPSVVQAPALQKESPVPATPSQRRDFENPLAPASFPLGAEPRPAASDPNVEAEMDKVSLMLRDYRTITGENPVGTNAEIMKAVMGANPRGAKLGPPEGMSLSGEGELVDQWGTPFFFHQLSKDLMEIHSAGPDRKMGTDDDFILK